ncbi:MAG: GTP cyclohydrolase I FolE [Bryobacteraceae bacterium]|nr:GTP cyclohydrolase I FolE [Bryobacteraceae bacterium]
MHALAAVEAPIGDPIAGHVHGMLEVLGENPRREGLLKTPDRAAKAMRYLTRGYTASLEKIVNGALFKAEVDEMVIVRDIEFFSLCEHHMLPFHGRVHVAYLPNKTIIGLSKIPRIIDMYARRLQVQERMTHQIAETLQQVLDARGVAVIAEGKHFCMMMRGVEKQCSSTTTSAMLGEFRTGKSTRDEFLSLLRMRSDF